MKTTQQKPKKTEQDRIYPVYLITGPEDFLVEQNTTRLKQLAVVPGTEDFNLDILYANETDAAAIVNIAMSYPMMAERRTVIVKNLEWLPTKGIELLVNYVQKPAPTTCLILTAQKLDFRKTHFSKIKAGSTFIEAKPLYENQIPDWVRNFLREKGLQISDEALRLLQASTGTSLRRIVSELEKVLVNLDGKTLIELADIERVVGVSRQFNIFEFCDAVGSKNIKKSIHILNGMLQLGESPQGMLAMLNRHFFILTKIKDLLAQNTRKEQMAKELKVNPYFVDNYARQASSFTRARLTEVFDLLLDADLKLKTSYQKPKMVLEMLLINICN